MPSRYRVFVGAPSAQEIENGWSTAYEWHTISSLSPAAGSSTDLVLPPATLEAASRRVETFYGNIIFDDEDEEPEDGEEWVADEGHAERSEGQTTAITWPPTPAERTGDDTTNLERTSVFSTRTARSSQDTGDTTSSTNYSDASSIAQFPNFHFLLSSLTPLSSAIGKISTVVAVLEVDGPDTIMIRKGPEAGKEVWILKMIVGDEEGAVAKLTAWREVAETWGGAPLKRGDVVLLENVTAAGEPVSLTASPHLKSKMAVCYRTMPYAHEDRRLRPDLRLGRSDPAVRKVAAVVYWFEGIAGLREAS
ncbi:hypothetical protein OE88DRAFT_1714873 [Heliocybe sulcata]|uniref:Shieldin complex subunit 2 first OB fold domain-containing protein n=1 Tax=Heliocybe sulcata TaxID=5364 RepID=A0A5C3MNY7_9AGAM|nr:hypothetical protein OE88DRAFT_1714873 [Heliocybe sulcata]